MLIINNGLEFTWTAQIRADVEFELLRKMRRAGCRLAVVGFESGSDGVLKMMKKAITVDQSRRFARAARKAGILIHGDFTIGMPGESKETIQETRRLINEIRPDIQVATPFPGAEFYEYVRNGGYLRIANPACYLDAEGHQIAVVNYPGLTSSEIEDAVDKILNDYYLSIGYLPLA